MIVRLTGQTLTDSRKEWLPDLFPQLLGWLEAFQKIVNDFSARGTRRPEDPEAYLHASCDLATPEQAQVMHILPADWLGTNMFKLPRA